MKKKFAFFISVLLLLSGCQAEYNLTIEDNGKITEELFVLQNNSFFGNSIIDINEQLDWSIIMNSDEVQPAYFYKKNKIVGSDKSGLQYNYDFDYNNFSDESEILKNCFGSYSFKFDDEQLVISATDFICNLSLGDNYNLTVNITANGDVLDGNFSKKSDNKYTWYLNESTSDYISLVLDRTNLDNGLEKMLPIFLIGVAVLIVGGIILIAYIKNKSNNKI